MSHSDVMILKDEIDENNSCDKPPIVGVKCSRSWCEEIHPIVRYLWLKDHHGHPSLIVNILCPNKEDMEKVFEAEKALSQIGIHFDTSYGGSRDWQFDYSLSGYHYILNKKGGYVPIERRNKDNDPRGNVGAGCRGFRSSGILTKITRGYRYPPSMWMVRLQEIFRKIRSLVNRFREVEA